MFTGTDTIFQKIGDSDQAIFSNVNDDTPVWEAEDTHLSIAHSNRYSQEIANVLSTLRSNQEAIISTKGTRNIKPTLFVYDSTSQLKVVPAFIKEIKHNGLVKPEGVYKAIGMFENVRGLKISDYWPFFQKNTNQKKAPFGFPDYVLEISTALTNGSLSLAEQWTRRLLAKVLHYIGKKDNAGKEYSTTSVKRRISQNCAQLYQSLILNLSQLGDYSYPTVEERIKELLTTLLGDKWFQHLPEFFIHPPMMLRRTKEESQFFTDDESDIIIEFDTVYGVKGETHDATLYLETETKNSSDIKRILPLLEHQALQSQTSLHEKSRRCVYVGFSRPRHLLCLAIQEKTYIGHEAAFSSWKTIDLRTTDAH